MRRVGIFLCGITAAICMTGCGSIMPDLTEEETEIISEYASGVLLKYDRVHRSRLMDLSEYEEEENKKAEREAARAAEQERQEAAEAEAEESASEEESTANGTKVIDASQDEETPAPPATIEEYYGIENFTFQYSGYELVQSYPSNTEEEIFFAMDATEGTQLLVLKFTVSNAGAAEQEIDMLGYGARFKVSVNGGSNENALSTMLLNDLQTYKGVVPAGSGVELVSIVEVPQSTAIETIDFVLRGAEGSAVINLQ